VPFTVSTREPLVQAILSYGRPGRGAPPDHGTRLGISGQDADQGVLVTRVEPGSLAEEAGLRQGDVITRIDSALYPEREELRQILRQKGRRDSVVLELRRGRHEVTMKIRL
jgi:putative serine protease PepD